MAIVSTSKQLAQRLIPSTTDTVIYQPPADTIAYIKTIIVCNTTAVAKTYSLYVNPNGSISGAQFALKETIPLAANASDWTVLQGDNPGIVLRSGSSSLIAKVSAANAVTITIYGIEVVET